MAEDLELRCTCRGTPLLALCGRDTQTGVPFVHVKTWKQSKIYAEVIITSGTARIRCRNCLRFHTVRIRTDAVDMKTERLPDSITVN